jgi:hypothetical protein
LRVLRHVDDPSKVSSRRDFLGNLGVREEAGAELAERFAERFVERVLGFGCEERFAAEGYHQLPGEPGFGRFDERERELNAAHARLHCFQVG